MSTPRSLARSTAIRKFRVSTVAMSPKAIRILPAAAAGDGSWVVAKSAVAARPSSRRRFRIMTVSSL